MTREQLAKLARDLYAAHTTATIEARPDYDPSEEYYFLGFKELPLPQRRLWFRVAEQLVGTIKPGLAGSPVPGEPDAE